MSACATVMMECCQQSRSLTAVHNLLMRWLHWADSRSICFANRKSRK